MINFSNSYYQVNIFSSYRIHEELVKRYFLWFCTLFVGIAALEFTQDYIDSLLNGNQFQPIESLSYKLFWVLFIPLSITMGHGLEIVKSRFTGVNYFICNACLVVLITLSHLLIFSLLLFGISNLIHESPWNLSILVTEKLSTRLYIALSLNIILAVTYFLLNKRESKQQSDQREYSKTLTIKNGQKSIIVNVEEIKWIGSDGPYLYIHTADRKHVILDSLKNIITTLPENFKRIHRSTIINIDIIKELKSRGNGDYDVTLDDGRELRLSRNYTKPLKGLLL